MHVHHDVAVAQSESGSTNTVSPCDDVSLALQKTRPEATTEHQHEHEHEHDEHEHERSHSASPEPAHKRGTRRRDVAPADGAVRGQHKLAAGDVSVVLPLERQADDLTHLKHTDLLGVHAYSTHT